MKITGVRITIRSDFFEATTDQKCFYCIANENRAADLADEDGDAETITDPHIPCLGQVSIQTRQKKKEIHTYTDVLAASHPIPHQDDPGGHASSCLHRKLTKYTHGITAEKKTIGACCTLA